METIEKLEGLLEEIYEFRKHRLPLIPGDPFSNIYESFLKADDEIEKILVNRIKELKNG